MPDIRDIRAKARGDLHARMQVPANLYATGNVAEEPIECTVRVHDYRRLVGDVKGTSYDFAERHEDTPSVIFLISEFDDWQTSIRRLGVISVAADTAYVIDNVEPRDGITVKANVTQLEADEAATYTPPEA